MTAPDPPQDGDAPRSSETVAVLDFTTPSGLTRAVAHASGHHAAFTPPQQPPRTFSTAPVITTPRRLIVTAVFVAALLGSLAWGVAEVRELFRKERQGPRVKDTGPVVAAGPTDEDTGEEDLEPEDAAHPGKRALAFLRTHVRRDGEADSPPVKLGESGAIAMQAVTVVNLWATWCGPCKKEFSGFQSMFKLNRRDQAWGPETRFVPILVDDEENARTAYRNWGPTMPDIHAALIDQKLDENGVRGALEQNQLLTGGAPLPVTLVFDCRRRIRWSKVGGLDEAAFVVLANEIDKLRGELGQDKCKPRRSASAAKAKPAPPAVPTSAVVPPAPADSRTCNNNGKCEPRSHEDCRLCPSDCPCKQGEQCNPRTPAVCKEAI